MVAQPKCPSCQVQGKGNLTTLPSEQKAPGGLARYEIIFCEKCGHVYGVYPNFMIQT